MIAAIKAEFRKLVTVKSTWMLLLAAILLAAGLVGFWIFGYKDVAHAAVSRDALAQTLNIAVGFGGVFMSFVAILLVGHEYRYNTIMYSLTSANHRAKVYGAKLVASLVFAIVGMAVVVALTIGTFYAGQAAHGVVTASQHIPLWETFWRSAVSLAGGVVYAFLTIFLVRNLNAAIAIVLLMQSTVESLLKIVLDNNVKYLPFTALSNLTANAPAPGASYAFSATVVGAYVVVLGAVSLVLFLRRDAN